MATATWWPYRRLESQADTTIERDLAAAGMPTRRGFPASIGSSFLNRKWLVLLCIFANLITGNATGQTVSGTVISNQATVSYTDPGGNPDTALSNQVDIVTTVTTNTAAVMTFNRIDGGGSGVPVGPTACLQGGGIFSPLPDPIMLGGGSIDPNLPQALTTTGVYLTGEAVFITLDDQDQNLDPATRETIEITVNSSPSGDSETLMLTETDISSGLFAGYIQTGSGPPVSGDCVLQVSNDSDLNGNYVDPNDGSDTAQAAAIISPTNRVFDGKSGNAVDGVVINLVQASSGLPATVYGDDGTSVFPASITSGGSVTDSGGQVYNFPPGGYRFPVVPAGNYRIEIDVPQGYLGFSNRAFSILQNLPGGPFSLSSGSVGNAFSVNTSQLVQLDIPLRPEPNLLYLQKSTASTVASPGDFVQYALELENTSAVTQPGVVINDRLPVGFRLVAGSVTIDGSDRSDPVVSNDGRTLSFAVGDLDSGESVNIRYVTEITVGANGDEAVNTAIASSSNGLESNQAQATLQLIEELFTDKSILVGRAIVDSCDSTVTNDLKGVPGLRIYMSDGRYVTTDDGGRYHFEGLKPGTHVVQLDVESIPDHLEIVDCETHSRFGGRNYSRFVDLRAGALWRADFHLREKPLPKGLVELDLDGERAGPDSILYTLNLNGQSVATSNVVLNVSLPKGLTYIPGSTLIDGETANGPKTPTSVVTYRLGNKPADWNQQIQLRAQLNDEAGKRLEAKAVATFKVPSGDSGRTPVAENVFEYRPELSEQKIVSYNPRFASLKAKLTRADRKELTRIISEWEGGDDVFLTAVGHTDSNPIEEGVTEFADNYALSIARATVVAKFIADQLDLPDEQLRINGLGPDLPVATNETEEGRAQNRRVDFKLERTVLISEAELAERSLGISRVNTQTTGQHEIIDIYADDTDQSLNQNPVFAEAGFIETLQPATRWLAPDQDFSPPIPAMKIAIQHEPEDTIELRVNNKVVDPLNFTGTEVNRSETVAISRWRGVDLLGGINQLTAVVTRAETDEITTLETSVYYGGGPARAEIDLENSRLIADGKTPPVIAVKLYDLFGEPARPSTTGIFSVEPPFRTQWEVDSLTENQLISVGNREPVYRVGANGLAYLKLEPTMQTGEATLRLRFSGNREQEVRVWIEPEPRDWILVGFAEGTIGHNTLKDNMEAAEDSGFEDDNYTDGQVSFFAKGQIKGEYLLTLAYQSDQDEDEEEGQLFGTIDPNRYYTLYGDTTEQRFEAASRRGLFLKIEREAFYALFGDFNTGLTVTELSSYNRSLNGLKTEFRGRNFGYNAFVSDTDKAFIRDEIIGDGTSGPFKLSDQDIVLNSDKLEIQVRDRFRSEQVLSNQPLTRYIDYTIDYDKGEIFFKRPVPSRDNNLNPIYIIANYETEEDTGENISAGGRGSWRNNEGTLEVGASVIHQGTEGDEGDLYGTDVRYRLNEFTEVKAELALSDTDQEDGQYGFVTQLEHQSDRFEALAWYHEVEDGFGLGQQNESETGMRKFGAEGRYGLTESINLIGAAFRQDNLVTDARQDVIEAEVVYSGENSTSAIGVVSANDSFNDGQDYSSQQVYLASSRDIFNGLMTVRGTAETAVNQDSDSGNYPDRLLLGLDYRITDNTNLFGEIESAKGDDWNSFMTRVGAQTQPWKNAQLSSTVNHQSTEYGPRTFATVGLNQGWQMNDRWYFDFGIDQSHSSGDEPERVNPDAPPASGNVNGEDFLATYAGALYRSDNWTFTSRTEYRSSDSEDRLNMLAGFYREQTQGHGFSANLQWLNSDFDSGLTSQAGNLRLGWSWRPSNSEWIIYDRLEFIYEKNSGNDNSVRTGKIINNLNANWMINLDTQLELQYGGKYSRTQIDADSYSSYTDIIGAGMRRNIGTRWDVGVHGDVLHSWNSDVQTYSWGVDVGVTILENIWISLGYNFAGFNDEDFSRADYTAQGPYLKFRIKADQDTFHNLINREAAK